MKRKDIGVLLLMFFTQFAMTTPPAQATSMYDSYIEETNQLVLHSDDTYYPCYNYRQDWSTSWTRWIYDPDFWSFGGYGSFQSDYIAAWEQAQTSGGWVVTDYYNDPSDPSKGVIPFIVFSPSPLYLDWDLNTGVSIRATDNSALYSMPIQIFQNEGCSGAVWTPERPMSHAIGNSTPGGYIRLFASGGSIDPNYPSGYEGEDLVLRNVNLVAMGDSFSSGEGNPPFEPGSNTNTNSCHRSPQAYPRLLQSDLSLNIGATAFVACSGATTGDVIIGKNGEPSQLDALSGDTEVVTITVGGNDVGFKDYIIDCGTLVCGPGTGPYNTIMTKIASSGLTSALESTYEEILDDAPNAEIYVIDYPYLTADDAGMCGVFDFSGGRDVQVALNSTIASAVDDVDDSRLHYVATNQIGSPFSGKHYCNGGTSDFNGFDASHTEYSFHPNADGQEDYAAIVKDAIG